ncbi:MAG: hypothetical protein O3A46_05270 [Candidatus Poribacteria bacterium]|nr:hypothetical protein [Candidatus Poribacteria bacterium]
MCPDPAVKQSEYVETIGCIEIQLNRFNPPVIVQKEAPRPDPRAQHVRLAD